MKLISGNWKRYIYDSLVIIGSILIAFTIDAWWSNKSNLQQKEALLVNLKQDFEGSREQLEELKLNHYKIEKNLETLLVWSEQESLSEENIIKFDSVLGAIWWRQVYDPQMGTLESIINTGRFDIIGNNELLSQLTKWVSLIKNLNEVETSKVEHFYNFIYPYLSSRTSLKNMDKGVPRKVVWIHQSTDTYKLLKEEKFQNLLYMHWVLQWNVNIQIPNIEDTLESILKITNQELLKYQ